MRKWIKTYENFITAHGGSNIVSNCINHKCSFRWNELFLNGLYFIDNRWTWYDCPSWSRNTLYMYVYMYICLLQAISMLIFCLLLLPSRFSRVRFSRQEHWSELLFPSPMHESEKWKWSCSVVSNPQRPHGLQPTRLLRPWDFPGKSTGVGCHCLLRIFCLDLYFSHQCLKQSLLLSIWQFRSVEKEVF